MVLEILDTLYFVTLLFALLTVVFGILSVNTLFGGKLKELFSDRKFFIFFFLLMGYVLFAMGELTWYLTLRVFEKTPTTGMPDFYWITGALFMLISFVALSYSLRREYGERSFIPLLIIGAALVVGVLLYVSLADGTFLGYLYPVLTSLILIFSATLWSYRQQLDAFEIHLLYLFFANVAFLGGDLLFSYWGASSIPGALSNIFYIFAYGLSAFTFLTLLIKFYRHPAEKALR